jgi:hypothetical protein
LSAYYSLALLLFLLDLPSFLAIPFTSLPSTDLIDESSLGSEDVINVHDRHLVQLLYTPSRISLYPIHSHYPVRTYIPQYLSQVIHRGWRGNMVPRGSIISSILILTVTVVSLCQEVMSGLTAKAGAGTHFQDLFPCYWDRSNTLSMDI